MPASTTETKEFMHQYIEAFNGKPKSAGLIGRFVTDPVLTEHILACEAAFPAYGIEVDQMVVEGDNVALRGTFHGTHQGAFAGMPATGKQVSAELMLFYRLADNHVVEHWMQLDMAGLLGQLNGSAA